MRTRFVTVAIGVFFLFSLLLIRFYQIQVIEHEKWAAIDRGQHRTVVKEPFKRGLFYSNVALKKGHIEEPQPLVIDVPAYHVQIDPMLIPEACKEEMIETLQRVLPKKETIRHHFFKKTRYRKIASMLSTQEKERIEMVWQEFAKQKKLPRNALYFVKDYQRRYPFGKMLGQVLHTVRDEKDEKSHQAIPTGGLESHFHSYLQGEGGSKVILRAPRYEMDGDFIEKPPKDGCDVYLTINHVLQTIAEEELAKGVKKVNAKGGWAVMMNPHTGELYAMAQYPFFDPAHYRDYYNDPEKLQHTRIKTITDCFEPGSTMKGLSIAIALKANSVLAKPLFSPEEMMRCDNTMFPGRTQPLRDMRKTHKYLNMYMAIQKSSNVYPARLIQRVVETLGASWYRQQLVETFGFGEKTGLELPYENPGMVPTPGKRYSNGRDQWSVPTTYSLAIGYNMLANSIQMVRAYAVLANGGYLIKPHLLKKIVSKEGVVVDNSEAIWKKRVLDEEIVRQVRRALKYTTKPGGSAVLADVPGFTEAGKTGTSEKLIDGRYSKSVHFSTFIGFAPVEQAEFVLFVGIDEPEKKIIPGFGSTQFGGKCAAPVFKEIARRSLEYLGVPPDDPKKMDWHKEVKELHALYQNYNET